MIAIPLGAAGCSLTNRWVRKNLPSSHSNVVRPRPVTGEVPGPKRPASNDAFISHWPISTLRRSSVAGRCAGTSPGLPDLDWAGPCGSSMLVNGYLLGSVHLAGASPETSELPALFRTSTRAASPAGVADLV